MPDLQTIFMAILVISVGFAAWQGGSPERWGAAVITAMLLTQLAARTFIHRTFDVVDLAGFSVDVLGFAGMTAIALHADRKWPLWTAALQLLSCMAHLVRIFSIKVEPFVYGTLKTAPTFLVLVILIVATICHLRRVRRNGHDHSWVTSLPPPLWMRSESRSSRS